MFVVWAHRNQRPAGRALPFALILAVALVSPGMLSRNGISHAVESPQPENPGLAPPTGPLVYFIAAERRAAVVDKWMLPFVAVSSIALRIDTTGQRVSALSQAALPQTHRLQYMIPMYFSTYT